MPLPPKRSPGRPGILPPRLGALPAVDALPGLLLNDDAGYGPFALGGITLAGQSARNISAERVLFKQVSWAETSLTAARFSDVRFDACDLAGADWPAAHMSRVEFLNCRLIGFKLQDPEIRDVLFLNCNLEFAACWSGRFKAAHFENCVLRGAAFEGTDLSGSVFRKCDLSGADFRRATLFGADLRGSTLAGVQVGIPELRGAIIEPSQTASLAGLLGVSIQQLDQV